MFDYLIVGAGFAGSVLAERLASDAGKKVLIVDRRPQDGCEEVVGPQDGGQEDRRSQDGRQEDVGPQDGGQQDRRSHWLKAIFSKPSPSPAVSRREPGSYAQPQAWRGCGCTMAGVPRHMSC